MTFLREAQESDARELGVFQCASDQRPKYELEVEGFIQNALAWRDTPDGADASVLVVEDFGEIAAVVIYEPDDGPDSYFINALAVRLDRQRDGLGERVMRTVLAELANRHTPDDCFVSWFVHPSNWRSYKLSEKMGATETQPPDAGGLLLFALRL